MSPQTHAELAAERDRLAAAHRAALDALERERERTAMLREALVLLLADVQDYEAWQRPCHAVDVARAALASVKAEPS